MQCRNNNRETFGLGILSGIIIEVAAANNIAPDMAVHKFFEDIEKNYDNKLGYDSKLVHLKSEIVKTNYELITVQKSLASKHQVAVALGELSLLGFNDQEIFNLALALQSNISNKESLEEDLNKYGSLKRSIEELTEELRILELTTMESIGFTCRLNMRIDFLETWQRKEFTILPPLVEAARGYKYEDNHLRTRIVDTTKLTSYVFHGINTLHSSDNARVLSDEDEDGKLSEGI